MVGINWCLKIKRGLRLVNPNINMSDSYMKMAEESLKIIRKTEDSRLWLASTSYYTAYYALYSLMMRIGVKSEIHKCSIEFMKKFLTEFYDREDINLIESAFDLRNDLQYYPDRLVNESQLRFIKNRVSDFLVKTKEILVKLNEKQIDKTRKLLEGEEK